MPAPRPGINSADTPGSDTSAGVESPTETHDAALVASIIRGEPSAWRLLLGRHQQNIYNLCLRVVAKRDLAEDLTQDTLVKVIKNIGRFDGRAKFSTWLYRITMNVCLSRLRSDKVRKHSSLDEHTPGDRGGYSQSVPGREPDASSGVDTGERRTHILQALDSLDPEQRAILVLRDTRDLDYDQIAEVLEVPVGTVKSRLFRARVAFRQAIESLADADREGDDPVPDR
jgi:RNA polymerase sigma-70 factor, ECF subfamily